MLPPEHFHRAAPTVATGRRKPDPIWTEICIGLALAFGLVATATARADLKVGEPCPVLAEAGLTGADVPDITGRVVLVDFWASWCAPCKASFPIYAKLLEDYQARGLVILAVSVDEKQEPYEAFVKRLAPPFAVVRDKAHELVGRVGVPAMPTCYLLGPDGKVRAVHQGFHGDKTEKELRKEIEVVLAEIKPS